MVDADVRSDRVPEIRKIDENTGAVLPEDAVDRQPVVRNDWKWGN